VLVVVNGRLVAEGTPPGVQELLAQSRARVRARPTTAQARRPAAQGGDGGLGGSGRRGAWWCTPPTARNSRSSCPSWPPSEGPAAPGGPHRRRPRERVHAPHLLRARSRPMTCCS
jgi:hypothetical protein